MGFFDSLFGGDSAVSNVKIPDFTEPEYFKDVQDILFPLGSNILSGDIPEYYSPIGEIGGSLFEQVLQGGINDIQRSGFESAARLNQRGGGVSTGIAKNVADYSNTMRYNDYLRALQGRQYLLNTGLNTMSGVRSGALDYGNLLNNYNLSKAGLELKQAGYLDQYEANQASNIGSAIGGGLMLAANIASGGTLTPFMSAGSLGSASASGLGVPQSYQALLDQITAGDIAGDYSSISLGF